MTDPQTDPWAAFPDAPVSAPAEASPFGSRPVIHEGPPQREPKDHFTPLPKSDPRYQPEYPMAQLNATTGEVSYGSKAAAEDSQDAQRHQAMEATRDLVRSIDKARGYVNDGDSPLGNTATQLGYTMLSHGPIATDASRLKATLDGEIKGSIFKNWMSSMKAATEQGGSAFGGRIMASEIPYIVNSQAALDPVKLNTKDFLGNLDQLEERTIRSAALLNKENPDDPRVMQKYRAMFLPPKQSSNDATPPAAPGAGGVDGGTPPTGGGNAPPRKLSQAEQQHFFDVLQHQGPDAADAYVRQFGLALKSKEDAAKAHSDAIEYPPAAHSFAVGAGGVAKGVGDLLGIVDDPLYKAINYVAGTHLPTDMGTTVRDSLNLPAPNTNTEKLASTIDEYGTQGLGFANAARLAAMRVPGIIGNALSEFGARPLTDMASAAAGGGASEATRQMGGGPIAQTAAGILAGGTGAALGAKANALSHGVEAIPSVVNAGKQEGVTVNRAMAFPQLTPKVIATGKTMAGAKTMGRDMAGIKGQIENRVQALGDGGSALEPADAGNTVAGAGMRYITQTGAQFNRLYGALRNATAGVNIPAKGATAQVDDLLGQLSEMPNQNAKEISYLQGLKQDLSQPLTIDAMRGLRTKIRQDLASGNLTFGPAEGRVASIADAAAQDISSGLQAAGKGNIANRFQQVDQAYRDRMNMIQGTVQKLIGKRGQPISGEQVYANLKSMAGPRGNASGLTRMLSEMAPDERSDIQATFADALGKDNQGGFSTAHLASQAQKMPQAMRTAVFGPDGAQSLDNLVAIAKEHARVSKALGGSPTALARDARGWVYGLIAGGGVEGLLGGGLTHSAVAGAATSAAIGGAKTTADIMSAKALMSPKITGWLRAAPASSDPAQINAWFNRLKVIAVREPALAPEVQRIQGAILKAANSNVSPAAAASGTDQSN